MPRPSLNDSTNVVDKSINGELQPFNGDAFAFRVRQLAQRMNFNGQSLGRALGISKSSAALYWAGERAWPVETIGALTTLLKTTADYLLGVDEGENSDLVSVSEIDLAYGLGGTFADGPVDTQVLRFGRSWLETITRTPPAMLTFARGRGDSMEPTLQDDDIVLIDRSLRTVREQDAIWALTIGDIAMIKRLRIRGERVQILSDNSRIPADEASIEEVNIVGRVVFIGRRL